MELYISNQQYSLLLRSFTALAFIPENKVVEFFKHLSDTVPQDAPTGVHAFSDYIAEIYVGHEVYERAENQGEGLILKLRRVPKDGRIQSFPQNYGLFVLLELLLFITVISKLVMGEVPKAPRKTEMSKNERIKKNCRTISTEGNG